jgi:hypothetical protein
MNFVTITITRIRRLSKPQPLPQITAEEMRGWQEGYWQGMSVGAVLGLSVGVLVGRLF